MPSNGFWHPAQADAVSSDFHITLSMVGMLPASKWALAAMTAVA
jgi:hypothetical protein